MTSDRRGATTVVKPEWGIKRLCQSCGARYYDFLRTPIVCPSCGTAFDSEAVLKSRRARPLPADDVKPKARKEAVVEDVEEEEDEEEVLDDEEEVLDDDIEEEDEAIEPAKRLPDVVVDDDEDEEETAVDVDEDAALAPIDEDEEEIEPDEEDR